MVEDRPAGSAAARKAMIDSQLRTSGVNAGFVLQRMSEVAREDFVPARARGTAYMDRAIRLENGRQLAAPVVQGMMLQEAEPRESDRAIVVDSGAGYLPELLRPLVASVEVITPEQALEEASGDATLLFVEGAAERLPDTLAARLEDGARLVTGIVQEGITRLATGRKTSSGFALLPLAELGIPVFPEFAAPKGWSF